MVTIKLLLPMKSRFSDVYKRQALGISCDELLGDTKGYSDLSRYDLQRYLPYGLTLLALLLYYVFLKLQISQLLSFAAFLGMMVFSNVLMLSLIHIYTGSQEYF